MDLVLPQLEVKPLTRPPATTIEVPGSKSHTNRALVCAALATGRSELRRILVADDTEAMLQALDALGLAMDVRRDDRVVTIDGPLTSPPDDGGPLPVGVRQSGTTGRFLLPMLAATPGRFVLDGDQQLRERPFGPQIEALAGLGAVIEGQTLPLSIDGRALNAGRVEVASSISSQFLSGLLLSAPLISGTTVIEVGGELVSRPYIDLTIATMARFGVEVSVGSDQARQTFTVSGGHYRPADLDIEPDASAASYFFAAAAITGGRVRVEGLGTDTVQGDLRFVDVLARMGAEVRSGPDWTEVQGPETLTGVTVDMSDISDTAQTLAVVASFADSPTEMTDIGFIRFKETDRIGAVVTELDRLGVTAVETEGGMIVHPGRPRPGVVATYDDHRMAMSFALLGLVHPGIEIENPGCVSKTFPDFFEVLDQLR